MEAEIKLSIIIPVFNCEKYLSECLNSIINKFLDNDEIEVIVINDGSTDNTINILDSYKSSNLKVFNNKNNGVSYSRNFGIEKASGKYIMFVDADDKLEDNWNEIITDILNENYDFILFTKENIISTKNDIVKYITGFNEQGICLAGPISKLYNREFIRNSNIEFKKDLINGEDMLFNCEVISKCSTFKIVNFSFYLYRLNQGSATKRFDEKIFKNDILFHEYLNNILSYKYFDEKLMDEIKLFSKQCGLFTILDRISYINNFKNAIRYLDLIDNKLYSEIINKKNINLSKYKIMILNLYMKNKYFLIFKLGKIKNKVLLVLRKKNEFKKV